VGALLQLTGQALWEFLTPYGSKSGWRVSLESLPTFRDDLADGEFNGGVPLFHAARRKIDAVDGRRQRTEYAERQEHEDAERKRLEDEERQRLEDDEVALVEPPVVAGPPWWRRSWWPGHETLIATEFNFYRDAPDPILQWCKRRYDRFMNALTASAAIVLGVVLGWYFLTPYPDLGNLIVFDAILLVVVLATMAWAVEVRRQAQEMERFWFAVEATKTTKPTDALSVRFDESTPLVVHTDGRGVAAAWVVEMLERASQLARMGDRR
jgi:hypothetical protein